MAKKKAVRKSIKTAAPKTKLNPKVILAWLLGVALLIGGYLYSNMEKASINEMVSTAPDYGKNTRPTPPQTVSNDCATVYTFSLSDTCGSNSYRNSTFTCGKTGTLQRMGGLDSCKTFDTWYAEAKVACANSCPTPTPIPSATPLKSKMPLLTPNKATPTPVVAPKGANRQDRLNSKN